MTGLLAVYPAQADDPKSPGSVFAPRQMLVVKLASKDGATIALSAEIKPRDEPTRGNRGTTMTDPDGDEAVSPNNMPGLPPSARRFRRAPSPAISAPGRRTRIPGDSTCAPKPSVQARVLGTLPPPYRLKTGGSENVPDRRLADRIPHHRLQGRLVPDRGREAARQAIRGREKISAQRAEALRRARLGRGQQGRRQLRQRRHPDGRAVPGAACRREVDAGAAPARRRARHRRRTETHLRLQRTLGSGGKP